MTTETLPLAAPIETRERTARDVLLGAARLIEERGWLQHNYRGPNGERCATSALLAAAHFRISQPNPAYCEANRRLERVIRDRSVTGWNDKPGRTEAEVLAALRQAAEGVTR